MVTEKFRLIYINTKTIYIPEGNNNDTIRRILDSTSSRSDYRLTGRNGVAVYSQPSIAPKNHKLAQNLFLLSERMS